MISESTEKGWLLCWWWLERCFESAASRDYMGEDSA